MMSKPWKTPFAMIADIWIKVKFLPKVWIRCANFIGIHCRWFFASKLSWPVAYLIGSCIYNCWFPCPFSWTFVGRDSKKTPCRSILLVCGISCFSPYFLPFSSHPWGLLTTMDSCNAFEREKLCKRKRLCSCSYIFPMILKEMLFL